MDDTAIKIDCFGDICPIPVLKAEDMLHQIKKGESFVLVTDHSCVVQSVKEKYAHHPLSLEIEEVMNGVWEITFTKR